jgi:predicted unusual protein kinase regulating ubiquinone biosynthesis (AarF/ABC1/UbiB family)
MLFNVARTFTLRASKNYQPRLQRFQIHRFSFEARSTTASKVTTDSQNSERFQSLLNDLRQILDTPNLATISFTRSLQGAKGLTTVAKDYVRNKDAFLDSKGVLSPPKTLRKLFEQLGATYIKLGQFIASSPTIFPAEYVEEFQACLDKTPSISYQQIRKIIQDDLQRPILSVFASIDPIPIATASIAQVHRGQLLDGTEVAIKVRKPGVDATLQADLMFLVIASKLIEFINPSISSFSLANILTDLRDSMLDELDFRKEAQHLLNFRSFLEQQQIVEAVAPKPYLQYSNERVLTMEYLHGIPLVDVEKLRNFTTNSPELTLLSALRTWATTVALNDQFHADLHAGNLLVLSDGRIGFIDFGIGT